jgi:ATP-dependent Clp protease ATP-binding subunit ClpC
VRAIASLFVAELVWRLAERRIELLVTDAVLDKLARDGFDPLFGARPLRREVGRQLENPLAMRIVKGECPQGSRVTAEVRENGVELRIET